MKPQFRSPKTMGAMQARSELRWGWLFMLPTIGGLIVLNIIPILQTLYQSFFKTGDFGRGNIFVGLENYRKVFGDKEVWQALLNTLEYTVIEVPVSIIIGLLLAVMLNRKMRGRTVYRTIYFLPMVAAPAAVAMVWRWLYNTNFGLINNMLSKVGVGPVSWVSTPSIAIVSIAVVGIWSCIGYNMILFLAGLQEIPQDYFEAAEIDGASAFQKLTKITVPMISPTIYFVATTRTIAAMQVFDLIYMMMEVTNPAFPRSISLVYLFYRYSFEQYNRGYGATIIVVLLVVILVLTVIQNAIQKRWVHYN